MKQYIRIHDRRKYISDFFVVDSSESLETIIKAVALKKLMKCLQVQMNFQKKRGWKTKPQKSNRRLGI